jgi:hypothetical protein
MCFFEHLAAAIINTQSMEIGQGSTENFSEAWLVFVAGSAGVIGTNGSGMWSYR